MHLFDIDIPGKITFQESMVLGPGNSLGMFDAGLSTFHFFLIVFFNVRIVDLSYRAL